MHEPADSKSRTLDQETSCTCPVFVVPKKRMHGKKTPGCNSAVCRNSTALERLTSDLKLEHCELPSLDGSRFGYFVFLRFRKRIKFGVQEVRHILIYLHLFPQGIVRETVEECVLTGLDLMGMCWCRPCFSTILVLRARTCDGLC